jgi:hypothetical protein
LRSRPEEWPEFIGGPAAGERVPSGIAPPICVPVMEPVRGFYENHGAPEAYAPSYRVEHYDRRTYQFAPGVHLRVWVHAGMPGAQSATELASSVVGAALSEVHRAER